MTDEINATEKKSATGIFIISIMLVIFVCACGYGYFQLMQINTTLAQMVTELRGQMNTMQTQVDGFQKIMGNVQQTAQKSQDLTAKQEQMIADWQTAQKGDLNKWYVAEAQYLVKLATDHVVFTHNLSLATTLLQRAQQILQNVQDNNLADIRKLLATDIANLQAMPQVDTTQLYAQLNTLDSQIDALPVPANPLQMNPNANSNVMSDNGLPWWKVGLNHSLQALSKIVVVRNNSVDVLPVVLPEEKIFLYQNLHAQFESIMWAVQYRNQTVYQASLARAILWIQHYFVQDAQNVKVVLQQLQTLQKINLQVPDVNLSTSTPLFDNYFSHVEQNRKA